MAAERWFRWHHGCVTDPKWRVIASRCVTSVTVGHVVTVWAAMLENASQAVPRGTLSGWDDEDIAVLFGYEVAQVSAIREAMQGKVLDGYTLLSWEKRQPKREDRSTDRTRNYRLQKSDAKNATERTVTQCDATEHPLTRGDARGEESREETERSKERSKASAAPAKKAPAPAADSPAVIGLPLNTGEDFPITAAQVREFSRLYPAADVAQELRGMRAWCITNPTQRKTRSGVMRFVNTWLSKAQNSGNSHNGNKTEAMQASPASMRRLA